MIAVGNAQTLRLSNNTVIKSSITIAKDSYALNADTSLQKPMIIISGNNITVDFNGAVLQGSNNQDAPNRFYGVAVKVEKGSSNITILNASIRGYKIAILADSVEGLTIRNCNLSYNYRQHLHSNWQHEDVSDWMSYHHNEHGEWLRYGAGIYLNNCNGAIIKSNTATNGQCGLMMTNCNNAEVYSNNFSFNSGLGIGMYRSSNNQVYSNLLDFNVRGYSDGIYWRGQDSGGILVFEQCNNNVFAYNSATHSGDGFFLWAGQTTMDSGVGGCNDNLLYSNDFSYAPTNGVELTFSRNDIWRNTIRGCDNGIWGGYSYESIIEGNEISNNKTGIAIEHGQNNDIIENTFASNNISIKLWSNKSQPADWGYAKYRDTKSKNYNIYMNGFSNEKTVFDIMGTDSISLIGNGKYNCNRIYKLGERVNGLDSSGEHGSSIDFLPAGQSRLNALNNLKGKPILKPKDYGARGQIRITEWGPYNFNYPMVFLQKVDSAGLYHFEVMHPGGNYKMKQLTGFAIISQHGDSIVAKADSSVAQRSIKMEYKGNAFEDILGKQHAANKFYTFSFNEFDPHANWQVNFYKWDEAHNPNKDYNNFWQSLQTPVYSTQTNKIDYTWWGAIGKGLLSDSFATVATTVLDLPEKDYDISVTGDDLVKLFIDDKPVIDAWDATNVDLDENTNHGIKLHLSGRHIFKIVHAENGGLATMMFYMKPVAN